MSTRAGLRCVSTRAGLRCAMDPVLRLRCAALVACFTGFGTCMPRPQLRDRTVLCCGCRPPSRLRALLGPL